MYFFYSFYLNIVNEPEFLLLKVMEVFDEGLKHLWLSICVFSILATHDILILHLLAFGTSRYDWTFIIQFLF